MAALRLFRESPFLGVLVWWRVENVGVNPNPLNQGSSLSMESN